MYSFGECWSGTGLQEIIAENRKYQWISYFSRRLILIKILQWIFLKWNCFLVINLTPNWLMGFLVVVIIDNQKPVCKILPWTFAFCFDFEHFPACCLQHFELLCVRKTVPTPIVSFCGQSSIKADQIWVVRTVVEQIICNFLLLNIGGGGQSHGEGVNNHGQAQQWPGHDVKSFFNLSLLISLCWLMDSVHFFYHWCPEVKLLRVWAMLRSFASLLQHHLN